MDPQLIFEGYESAAERNGRFFPRLRAMRILYQLRPCPQHPDAPVLVAESDCGAWLGCSACCPGRPAAGCPTCGRRHDDDVELPRHVLVLCPRCGEVAAVGSDGLIRALLPAHYTILTSTMLQFIEAARRIAVRPEGDA